MLYLKFLFFILIFASASCQVFKEYGRKVKAPTEENILNAQQIFKNFNLYEQLGEILLQNFTKWPISLDCLADLAPIIASFSSNSSSVPDDFKNGPLIEMIDATGKPPSGILLGALTFWGYVDECKRISYHFNDTSRNFEGSFSRVFFNLNFLDGTDPENCDIQKTAFGGWDLCTPKSCANKDDLLFLTRLITIPNTTYSPVCDIQFLDDQALDATTGTWIVGIIMGSIIILGILASIVDYLILPTTSPNRKNQYMQMLLSFSIYKNTKEIFTIGGSKNKTGQINPIHCIRFLSISWVLMGHVFNAGEYFLNNAGEIEYLLPAVTTQILLNAYFSVDSFFFIGGLLLSFLWFREFKKDKHRVMSPKAWVLFYLHRIVRISPPFYMITLFYTFIFPLLTSNMPAFMMLPSELEVTHEGCLKKWWTYLFYGHNFVHWNTDCYGAVWYLATDMQMFIFTPLLLIPLGLNKILGLVVCGFVFFLSTAANIFTVYKFHYPPTYSTGFLGMMDPKASHLDDYELYMYQAPWIRCQIYIMGILVGYFLQMKNKMKINMIVNIFLWICSFVLMLTVLLSLKDWTNSHEISLFARAMYSSLSKPAWGLGLSWIVISCYYGYGGIINEFMSWNIWVPLGRLSYGIYLVHIQVLIFMFGMQKSPVLYSTFIGWFLAYVIPGIAISTFVAIFWSALFELPFTKIEMLLLRSKMSAKKEPVNDTWETKNNETELPKSD